VRRVSSRTVSACFSPISWLVLIEQILRLSNADTFTIEISLLKNTMPPPTSDAYELNLKNRTAVDTLHRSANGQQTIKRYTTRGKKPTMFSLEVKRFDLVKSIRSEVCS